MSSYGTRLNPRSEEDLREELRVRRERYLELFGVPLANELLAKWLSEHLVNLTNDFLFANFNHYREKDTRGLIEGLTNGRFEQGVSKDGTRVVADRPEVERAGNAKAKQRVYNKS